MSKFMNLVAVSSVVVGADAAGLRGSTKQSSEVESRGSAFVAMHKLKRSDAVTPIKVQHDNGNKTKEQIIQETSDALVNAFCGEEIHPEAIENEIAQMEGAQPVYNNIEGAQLVHSNAPHLLPYQQNQDAGPASSGASSPAPNTPPASPILINGDNDSDTGSGHHNQ